MALVRGLVNDRVAGRDHVPGLGLRCPGLRLQSCIDCHSVRKAILKFQRLAGRQARAHRMRNTRGREWYR